MEKEVIEIVKKAGKKVMQIYNSDYEITNKKDKSPVTIADLESEKILIKGLERFGYGIVSEESGFIGESTDKFWVMDPLDGTKDFIQKTGEFAVMVGLVEGSKPILGVVYCPALDKLYYAQKGKGAFLVEKGEARRIKVNSGKKKEDLLMVISNNHFRQKDKDIAVRLGVKEFKGMGSVGVKFCAIAEGMGDLCVYTTNKLGIWDACAPHVILKEAGGEVFDLLGGELEYFTDRLNVENGFIGSIGFRSEVLDSISNNKGFVLWFTGLSGSGKSTLAEGVSKELKKRNVSYECLDGDEVRENLTQGLLFTKKDRDENIRRIMYVCKLLSRNGVKVISAFISPYKEMRDFVRNNTTNFIEVHVATPLEVCEKRDVKGLYKKARTGEIKNFTGISDPYEEPVNADIVIKTQNESVEESVGKVVSYLEKRGLI
jgi:3'(2'),5'-bisphosphate nucleotidase